MSSRKLNKFNYNINLLEVVSFVIIEFGCIINTFKTTCTLFLDICLTLNWYQIWDLNRRNNFIYVQIAQMLQIVVIKKRCLRFIDKLLSFSMTPTI